ncbi:MAG: hypothetical protein ACK5LM_05540 [Lactovum sp.]
MKKNNKSGQYSRTTRRLSQEKQQEWERKEYSELGISKKGADKNQDSFSSYDSEYRFDRERHREGIARYQKSQHNRKSNFKSNYLQIEGIKHEIAKVEKKTKKVEGFEYEEYHNFEEANGSGAYFLFLILSLLVSFSFYSFPFIQNIPLENSATNFYSGFLMNHGLIPYIDIYTSAGPLFYLLNALGTSLDSTSILWALEIIFVWFSSILIFKVLSFFVQEKKINVITTSFLIFAIAGLSLGGNQPIIYALPFALYGFLVLSRYFIDNEAVRDEVFILFGMAGALASLFFPFFIIFWLVGVFGLAIKNISISNVGRGFYQLLSTLLGIVLVYALVGYYTLTSQIFFPTIKQSILIPFSHLNFSFSGWVNLSVSLALLLLFGLSSNFFAVLNYIQRGFRKMSSITLLIAALFSLIFISLVYQSSPANALVILPFLFIYLSLNMEEEFKSHEDYEDYRVSYGDVLGLYLKKTFYLPLIALIFLLSFPFTSQLIQKSQIESKQEVVSYLREKSESSDTVTVLSDNQTINYLSNRYSTISFPPSYYPISYTQSFDIDLVSAKIKYIVWDKRIDLLDTTKEVIESDYKEVDFSNSDYAIYKIK